MTGKTADELNALFQGARQTKFDAEVARYWYPDDVRAFMADVEINAGTDERAKNTYPYSFTFDRFTGRFRLDDTDSRFDATNRGLPDKPYSIEVHDKDESGAALWNGETNNLFNLFEANTEAMAAAVRRHLTAMQALGGLKSGTDLEKFLAYYRKYYFSQAQEYFPAVAYNADAKYCYEEGKLAYDEGRYSNDTDPIEQAFGDHYFAEQRWITKRMIYIMSKYSFGLFSASDTDIIVVRAAGDTITYDITPAMDMYPAVANGTSIIRGNRTKAGEVCHIEVELGGAGDQQNAIMAASYLQDIGDWYNKNVTGSMIVQGKMLREIRLGHATEDILISITSLTISNCVSLQKLILTRIATLSGTLNLSACSHLKEVYIGGTSIVQLVLPEGGGLELVEYNALSQYLILKNYPLLTNEGVIIDECKEVITDFLVSNCVNINPMQLLIDIISAQSGQGAGHALKRIRSVGFDETFSDGTLLDVLTSLTDGSYVGLDADGLAGEDPYPVLDGTVNVNSSAYEDTITSLKGFFPNLILNITGEWFVRFADPEVLRICLENWDTNHDGGLTKSELAAVSTHGTFIR